MFCKLQKLLTIGRLALYKKQWWRPESFRRPPLTKLLGSDALDDTSVGRSQQIAAEHKGAPTGTSHHILM
jgi:hypothetical protein